MRRVLSWIGHFFDLLLSETMRPSRIVESAAGSGKPNLVHSQAPA